MAKKTIGIPMANMGENSVGMTKPYLEYLKKFGQVILLTPDAFLPDLNLLILPGGKDIAHGNPNDYSFYNSDHERFLEHFDKFTLPKYINNGTSVYGICRGFQTLMRHFGIPIIQNIWWDHGYSKDENETEKNELTYLKYGDLFGMGVEKKKRVEKVGSWHHQGVSMQAMNEQNQFDVIAYTKGGTDLKEYQIVEYVEHRELPIIGEQSHPERNDNALEKFLIKKLLNRK